MNIPLEDILETRYVEQQLSHGLSNTEVFERRMHRLFDSYINTLKDSYENIMEIDGTFIVKFKPSTEGLQINMNYDDGKNWITPIDRDDFNEALAHRLRSKASHIRATKQYKWEKL